MDVDLNACIGGEKRAWDAFVDRYSGVIHAAVRRTIRTSPGGIDDPVQEVFVRLVKDDFRLLRGYDPSRAALTTWLTLVARSVAIDYVRKRRLDTVPLQPDDEPPRTPTGRGETVLVPLNVLTDRQRLVLRMLFDEEMSVPEAARLMEVDEQTIRSTKHKALSRLRAAMSPK